MTDFCARCDESYRDLFVEELVALTGLEPHIPDLLWGATVRDLRGLQPSAVYLYDWREVDRGRFSELKFTNEHYPYIDLESRGIYIGVRRDANEIDIFKLIEALARMESNNGVVTDDPRVKTITKKTNEGN